MYLILAIALFAFFLGMERNSKRALYNRKNSSVQNNLSGYIEYILSWNIFYELTREVYTECLKRGMKDVGIYDEEFDDVGKQLYSRTPVEESVIRAKREMIRRGWTPHVSSWRWDDQKRSVSDFTREQMSLPVEKRGMDMWKRPDLVFEEMYFYFGEVLPAEILPLIPDKNDLRRTHYKRAGSYLWRPKEDCSRTLNIHRWPPRKRLGRPIWDPDEFIQDTEKFP